MLSNILQKYHETHRAEILFANSGIARKAGHVQRVKGLIKDYPNFFLDSSMDFELALICAEHHDDGRLLQYEQTGKLDDNFFSHQSAGLQMLHNFCLANKVPPTFAPQDIQILGDVMMYHGKLEQISSTIISPQSMPYVKAISKADILENSMSCVSYLKQNYYGNEKNLSYEHYISAEVWEFYTTGTLFSKIDFCKTYDEYILFAGTLVISSIKKYDTLAKKLFRSPGFGYPSILEGFHDIFDELLLKEDAEKAYQIMYYYVMD